MESSSRASNDARLRLRGTHACRGCLPGALGCDSPAVGTGKPSSAPDRPASFPEHAPDWAPASLPAGLPVLLPRQAPGAWMVLCSECTGLCAAAAPERCALVTPSGWSPGASGLRPACSWPSAVQMLDKVSWICSTLGRFFRLRRFSLHTGAWIFPLTCWTA